MNVCGPNSTSSKVIAITIGTIKYCYNIQFVSAKLNKLQLKSNLSYVYLGLMSCIGYSPCLLNLFVSLRSELIFAQPTTNKTAIRFMLFNSNKSELDGLVWLIAANWRLIPKSLNQMKPKPNQSKHQLAAPE